jgi:hypothetical protein
MNFFEWNLEREKLNLELSQLKDKLEKENPNLILNIHLDPSGAISIEKIVVSDKNKGTGTKVIKEICDFADSKRLICILTPSSDFGGSVTKLKEFYKRFGFVYNSGKNKDFRFRSTMLRVPK